MNDDTKQFIAHGIALKFGEMATRLVKTMKFQPAAQGSEFRTDDGYVFEWNGEVWTDGDMEFSGTQESGPVEEGGLPLDGNFTAGPNKGERRSEDEPYIEGGGEGEAALETAIAEERERDPDFDEKVAAWNEEQAEVDMMSPEVQEMGEVVGPAGDAKYEYEDGDISKEEYAARIDAMNTAAAENPQGAKAYQRGIDANNADAKAAGIVSDSGETKPKAEPQDEPKKKSDRCETGTRKDPKTGQCKPHQARQAMNNNVKMYIANGIAMRFGQVAANFVKTMKFQGEGVTIEGDPNKYTDGSWQRKLAETVQVQNEMAQESDSSFDVPLNIPAESVESISAAVETQIALEDKGLLDLSPEESQSYQDAESVIGEGWQQHQVDMLEAGAMGLPWQDKEGNPLPGHAEPKGAGEGGGAGAEGGDTGVEGGGEWPGGPGGGGPKRDQYEWEQDSSGSVTITDTTTGASAFIQVGSDGLSELKAELKNAPDEHSQQLIMDQYSTIMDPPEGGGGAEGEAEEKKSKSDRCETGTHKDPKTGQCKPI